MGKHYYLTASLPYLKFGKETTISSEEFLTECEKWVSPQEMEFLNAARLPFYEQGENDTLCLREWREFDKELSEQLCGFRKNKQEGKSGAVTETIKFIVDQETPLLMEMAFEKTRWTFLDQRSAEYHFDINWLIFYLLKLQIIERLKVFDKDEGEKRFYKLCEVNYEKTIR